MERTRYFIPSELRSCQAGIGTEEGHDPVCILDGSFWLPGRRRDRRIRVEIRTETEKWRC